MYSEEYTAARNMRHTVLAAMTAEINKVNHDNGWYDHERSVVEGHMLLVTEASEATEAFRRWGLRDATSESTNLLVDDQVVRTVLAKPEGVGSEYADILIRLLDQCDRDGIDLEFEFERKMAYNRTRSYRHGDKTL